MSSEHIVAIPPLDVRSFSHLMERGVVRFLEHDMFGVSLNRRELRDLAKRVKRIFFWKTDCLQESLNGLKYQLRSEA